MDFVNFLQKNSFCDTIKTSRNSLILQGMESFPLWPGTITSSSVEMQKGCWIYRFQKNGKREFLKDCLFTNTSLLVTSSSNALWKDTNMAKLLVLLIWSETIYNHKKLWSMKVKVYWKLPGFLPEYKSLKLRWCV